MIHWAENGSAGERPAGSAGTGRGDGYAANGRTDETQFRKALEDADAAR